MLGLLLVGVPIIAFTLLEGAASAWLFGRDIAAVRPDTNFRRARFDTLVGWVGIPDLHLPDMFSPGVALTNNADGMRIHRPVTPALAPGRHRVICSGDSFTNGWGVGDADTFCAALEQVLPGVESLNMAQPGYGIDQAYLWYKRDAGRWPHQVHLFAFIWNDFERMALRDFSGYAKPRLRLVNGAITLESRPQPEWSGGVKRFYYSRLLPRLRLFQLVDRNLNGSDSVQLARVDAQVWDLFESIARDLDRLNRERGSQLVLTYLPTNVELVPGPYDARRARLAAFAARAKIPLVDLTPAMRAVPPDSAVWFFITANQLQTRGASGHYTTAGHRWVAQALAERLRADSTTRAKLGLEAGDAAARRSAAPARPRGAR
ncbi:MAG: hypothetical protein HY275_10705 [Gemmatimonadetes bacterium]|nr:hypothetical protein [Gemmatimonadota bacterium]